LVLGPWSLVLGPWSLVLGPWSLVLGPWFLVLGPWFLVLGSWSLALGPWFLVLGPWSLVLGPWFLALGPWSLVLGPWFLVLGSWSLVLGSSFLVLRSSFLPKVPTTLEFEQRNAFNKDRSSPGGTRDGSRCSPRGTSKTPVSGYKQDAPRRVREKPWLQMDLPRRRPARHRNKARSAGNALHENIVAAASRCCRTFWLGRLPLGN